MFTFFVEKGLFGEFCFMGTVGGGAGIEGGSGIIWLEVSGDDKIVVG